MRNNFISDKNLILILIIIAVIISAPVFSPLKTMGGADWDSHLTYNEVALKSILEFKQFPLWNPYECGGTPLLAHPESLFLTPFFFVDIVIWVDYWC